MAPLNEQIIDNVQTALATVSGVSLVVRSSMATVNTSVFPTVALRQLAETKAQHLRLAVERQMVLECEVIDADYSDEARASGVGVIVGRIEDKIFANETWSGLAIGTEIMDSAPEFGEGISPRGSDRVRFKILYRTKLNSASTQWTV